MASAATRGRGYADPGYAHSLFEFGLPRALPRSGGCVLERAIAGTGARDLMGPYPVFACADWSRLADDLEALGDCAVSLVAVVDPLAGAEASQLERAFPDHLRTFNTHFIVDLDGPASITTHHRREVRRAARAVEIEICAEPLERLDDWVCLYEELVARHGLVGISAFSRASFRRQLALAGMVALRAVRHGRTVAMTLWLEDAPNAHYHLAASSREGYEAGASYALVAAALEHLRERGVRRVNLGGVPAAGSRDRGLADFKRGWASEERPARLCGRILDRTAYAELSSRGGASGAAAGWFPAYRATDPVPASAPKAKPAA
ncbi:MAG: DUF2156 domain-containing protein [Chloroflexota bacterium]|nr:DUF2156 domain-containing protein [Chloroflexota bacterium]